MVLDEINFTFLGEKAAYEEAEVIVIPVEYSPTSSFVSTKYGARAIIEGSYQVENFDKNFRIPKIYTTQIMQQDLDPERMLKKVGIEVEEAITNGKFPLVIGGEHTISVGAFKPARSLKNAFPVIFDAHADFRKEFEGSRYSHACTSRRIFEISNEGLVIGVRSISGGEYSELKNIQESSPWKVVFAEEIKDGPKTLSKYFKILSKRNVYISFDFDFIDGLLFPSVGNPEPFGFSFEEALEILKMVKSFSANIVGADFCEFSPTLPQYNSLAANFIFRAIVEVFSKSK